VGMHTRAGWHVYGGYGHRGGGLTCTRGLGGMYNMYKEGGEGYMAIIILYKQSISLLTVTPQQKNTQELSYKMDHLFLHK
jgi:hypothetical protein